MRKLWYAGAVVAGGFVLFGASPAQADLLPGTGTAEQQADERLADMLVDDSGVDVQNPLRYSTLAQTPVGSQPVLQFTAGQNSPDLNPLPPGEPATEDGPDLPAADMVGGALQHPTGAGPVRRLNMPRLPFERVFGLPLFGGFLPDGGQSDVLQQPTMRQTETFDGGIPLLGGLGGLLPANELPDTPMTGTKPDTSGLPAGGIAVPPAATKPPAVGQTDPEPAAAQPATRPAASSSQQPAPSTTPDDPRLHEEPIDGETEDRQFSEDGRPVAGVDQQYR